VVAQARRIRFTRSGGFAGITLTAVLDGAREAAAVDHLVSGLANLPPAAASPQGHDRFVYSFTVEDTRGGSRDYVVPEEALPASLHPVVHDLVQRAMGAAGE
jgi:hypothetical protein